MSHTINCRCLYCTDPKGAKKIEVEGMRKYGFYMLFIIDACDYPNHTNFVTRGLTKSFNHPELQLCFPLPQQLTTTLFHNAVHLIRTGVKFEPGIFYEGIMGNGYKVQFIEKKDKNINVLRMIVPDKNHKYSACLQYLNQFF